MKIGTIGSAFCSALLFAASTAFAAPAVPPVEWTSAFGGPDEQWIYGVLPVADGYVGVGTHIVQPGHPLSGGSMACFLAKTDLAGSLLWQRSYEVDSMAGCYGVAPAPGGGYLVVGSGWPDASYSRGRIVLFGTDAGGNRLWTRFYDANEPLKVDTTYGQDIVPAGDGGFVVLGELAEIGLADRPSPLMLLKVDADGNELWRTFPGDPWAEAYKVRRTADGGFVVGGWRYTGTVTPLALDPKDYHAYLLRVDASGNRVWSADYALGAGAFGEAVRETPDGGFAVAGFTGDFNAADSYDALLLKVDAAGALQWTATYGGPGDDFAADLAIAPDGGILVTGSRRDPCDAEAATQLEQLSVAKFSAAGEKRWEILTDGAAPGEAGYALGMAIEATPDGGAIVAGEIYANNPGSATDGDVDAWLIKLAPEPAAIAVLIDVKPGSDENPINLKAQGTVPVAILTTASFDADTVDRGTVRFAGAPVVVKPNGKLQAALEDADGDGDEDLVLHFNIPDLHLEVGDTTATLAGATQAGAEISGTDTVKVTKAAVGKKAKKATKKKK